MDEEINKSRSNEEIRIRNSTIAFIKKRIEEIRRARDKELRESMPADYPMKLYRIRLDELNTVYDLITRDLNKMFKKLNKDKTQNG